MKKTELAYTAGIIDGEGSIVIRKSKAKTNKLGFSYMLLIAVSNTDKILIDWLQLNYGGSTHKLKRYETNKKEAWRWVIASRQAGNFLALIYPYLLIKKPQATVALRFYAFREKTGRRQFRYNPKTDGERAVEQAEAILMSQLNKRGKENEIMVQK